MFEVKVRCAFEAAHRIVGYPGKCERLHGHNWEVETVFAGEELNDLGMLIDFKQAKEILANILNDYDHRYLNETTAFERINPTAENIANYVFAMLAIYPQRLPEGVSVKSVTVYETPHNSATFRPSH